MPVSLDTLIARTQAAIDTETDSRKLRPLQANLAAFLATKAEMDGDDDEDDDDEGDEDSKSKKAAAAAAKAKGKAEAAKHRAKAAEHKAKAAEAEEAAKKCEESEEESEESSAIVAPGSVAAAHTHDGLLAKLATKVAEMERSQAATAKTSLIDGARKLGAITKAEAAWLGAQALGAVETFLEMRAKAGLVATSEDALIKPKDVKPGTEESLPAEVLQMIDAAVNVWTGDKKTYREELVKNHLAAHTKQVNAALNGAGRY